MTDAGYMPWSLAKVFGRPIQGSCPLGDTVTAAPGTVDLEIHPEREVLVETSGSHSEHRTYDGLTRRYELPVSAAFDINLRGHVGTYDMPLEQPLLYAERTITGHGQERGGLHSVLSNPSSSSSVDLIYLESLPWFMKPYLHTLTATTSARENSSVVSTASPITSSLYRPGIDRERGTHLELHITVPPSSTVVLTYDFEKAILRYTEYPPDANRGFDVAPAIIRVLPKEAAEQSTYLRTTSLLLPLPTPDFSMPYNVIILTSTVIAMGFGSIFNLLVRRFVASDEVERRNLRIVKAKVLNRLQTIARRLGLGSTAGELTENGTAKAKKIQ